MEYIDLKAKRIGTSGILYNLERVEQHQSLSGAILSEFKRKNDYLSLSDDNLKEFVDFVKNNYNTKAKVCFDGEIL